MRKTVQAAAVAWLVGALALPAAADVRVATVFEEQVAGAARSYSAAETELVRLLLGRGVAFVDEEQARQIRSVTDAGQLAGGPVPAVITSLDADVVLGAVVRIRYLDSALLGDRAFRADATVEGRLVAVDTGRILAVFRGQGAELGFSREEAADKAAIAAAKAVADEVYGALAPAAEGRKVEILVTGLPDVTAGERVVAAVRALPSARSCDVRQAGRGATKLVVETDGATARELALALDATPASGLTVFGYSDGAIKAEYVPAAALALTVVAAPTGGAARGSDAWQGPALRGAVLTALSNLPFVSLPRGDEPVGRSGAAAKAALTAAGLDPGRTIVVETETLAGAAEVQLRATLRHGGSGETVASGQRACPRESLAGCAATLGDELAAALLPGLQARRHLVDAPRALRQASAPTRKPIEIKDISLPDIFPARFGASGPATVGTVRLRNTGDVALSAIVLSTQLPELAAAPLDSDVGSLAPGEEREVAVPIVLDAERLAALDRGRSTPVRLELRYTQGDYTVRQSQARAVVVHDRNAIAWSTPESVAAFVTPRSAAAVALARAAQEASHPAQGPLDLPLALFEALRALRLRYAPDPVNPYGSEALDSVSFPDETVAAGGGDCDDLAVLYAALAEAAGLEAAIVLTPEHAFAAVALDVPPQGRESLSLAPDGLLVAADRTWLPIETSALDEGFAAAWRSGAAEARRYQDGAERTRLVAVRSAWKLWPPAALARPPAAPPSSVPVAELRRRVEDARQALEAARARDLEAAAAGLTTDLAAGRTPALLGRMGRLRALQGARDAAQQLFEEAAALPDGAVVGHNGLGNLALVEGRTAAARDAYQRALAVAPDEPRVQVNAALAAFVAGDDDAFAEHLLRCLELGAEAEVESLSRAGGMLARGARGADVAGRGRRELREALARVYERASRPLPAALEAAADGPRASEAGEAARVPVGLLVFWL